MPRYVCPHCGDPLTSTEVSERQCLNCRQPLPPNLPEAIEPVVPQTSGSRAASNIAPGSEPWFYSYLEYYAHVLKILTVIVFGAAAVAVTITIGLSCMFTVFWANR